MITSGSSERRNWPLCAVTATGVPSLVIIWTKMPESLRPSSLLSSMRIVIFAPKLVNSPTLIEAPSAPERSSKRNCS